MPELIRRWHGYKGDEDPLGWAHWCPACEEAHVFAVDRAFANGACWTFNGNLDEPSFQPSMRIRVGPRVCHYFLTKGQLAFCGDCTHALRGQTVPLPAFPA